MHTNPNLKHRIDDRFEGKIQSRIPFSPSSVIQLDETVNSTKLARESFAIDVSHEEMTTFLKYS